MAKYVNERRAGRLEIKTFCSLTDRIIRYLLARGPKLFRETACFLRPRRVEHVRVIGGDFRGSALRLRRTFSATKRVAQETTHVRSAAWRSRTSDRGLRDGCDLYSLSCDFSSLFTVNDRPFANFEWTASVSIQSIRHQRGWGVYPPSDERTTRTGLRFLVHRCNIG
jgi:hypothetical protein